MRQKSRKLVKNPAFQKIKHSTEKAGLYSLALLIGLAHRGAITLASILEGPSFSMSKGLDRLNEAGTIQEYYELLKSMKRESARVILWRLGEKGLVEKRDKNYFITKVGLRFVQQYLKQTQQKAKETWDGKWRLVTFDIPEKMASARQWLRNELRAEDYKLLQKSVFVGKRPLARKVVREIIERGLLKYVRLITVGEIDDESLLTNL